MHIATDEPNRSLSRQSVLVASVCVLADALYTLLLHPEPHWTHWTLLALVVVADASLAGPARLSGYVAALHAVVVAFAGMLHQPGNNAGLLIAGYRAGAWLSGWRAWTALSSLVLGRVLAQLTSPQFLYLLPVAVLTGALLPWLVGRYTTARRAHLAELEQRAERELRDTREATQRAVEAERQSIARDLHDVIAHHVSAINLHAGAARLSLGGDPGAVLSSLSAVESASQAAMVDLRHLLDVLHGDSGDGDRQPGLSNVEELLERVRAAGVPARLRTEGQPRAVPDSLGITVYRIIQEMLTNAVRHGDSGGVDLALTYRPGSLELASRNTIAVRPTSRPGARNKRGLAGIRSRAELFDGVTTYGPAEDGRTWRTTVEFPLGAR
ncbi:signal transduction histidine kinase [Crossiella equi]|uniref:histidine kinase n=1 Tax=Crossiella equi TaxID=130796 RepID=A0ABS5A9G5_9PSEU|nr:histidine kinase [Crossiella equi]MBP2473228.1 signal transduction histidine kinase [Crossiella equi]